MKTLKQLNKELWDLELELSSGYKSWHDLEIALGKKKELEKQLSEIISSPKPMKAKKKVNKLKKAVTAKSKKALKAKKK